MSKKAEMIETLLREMVTEESEAKREAFTRELLDSDEFGRTVEQVVDASVESKVSDAFESRSFKRAMQDTVSDALEDVDFTSISAFEHAVEGIVDGYDLSDKVEDAVRDGLNDYDFSDAIEEAVKDYDFSDVIERVIEEHEDKLKDLVEEEVKSAFNSEDLGKLIDAAVAKAIEAKADGWRKTVVEKIEGLEKLLKEIKESL